jgi:cell division protease FtsH
MDVLHKLAEELLEKETVMGKELDELIIALRPGIKLHSYDTEEPDTEPQAASEPA